MQIWWLTSKGTKEWTLEERRARRAIYGVAVPIFAFLFFLVLTLATVFLHWRQAAAILLALAAGSYTSLFLARAVCFWAWPDLMRRADANAANRLGFRRV
jgi:hypothetical protein